MFSLGSASMLFWGLAIAVPIVLHLLRKRKSRTVAWGAMRFLQAAMVKRSKRFQLWRLLLLLLRVAAILALAIAVARPLLEDGSGSGVEAESNARSLNIFVFDTSYSMRATSDGETRFAVAQRHAIDLANRGEAGDGFLLMSMGRQPEWIGSGVSYRGEEVAEAIGNLSPGEGTADLNAAISALQTMVEATVADGWRGGIRVWFYSDLQPLTWDVVGGGKQVEDRFANLEVTDLELLVVDCRLRPQSSENSTNSSLPTLANQIVSGMQADRRGAGQGSGTIISAEILNDDYDGESDTAVLAQLLVDGRIQQSQRIELGAGENRLLSWDERLRPGRHLLETRLASEDAIALDNIYRTVIESEDAVPVALFARSRRDARFLALAAEPSAGGVERGFGFEVQQYEMAELARRELGRERLWVLCDPSPLDPRSLGRLEQHVQRGGGVIWWLGPNWVQGAGGLDALDGSLGEPPTGESWSATEIVGGRQGEPINVAIDPLEYEDPIIAPFQPFPGSGLLTLPVFRYWRLQLDERWTTSLGISAPLGNRNLRQPAQPEPQGGQQWDALIARLDRAAERFGLGREVIVATPPGPGIGNDEAGARVVADDESNTDPWNALIAWPAFVPLVQEMFYWASSSDKVADSFTVGELIVGQALESEFGAKAVGTTGDTITLNVLESVGKRVRWSGGIANRSGVYRWAEGPSEGELAFVVNVDASEGELTKNWSVVPPFKLMGLEANDLGFDVEPSTEPAVDSDGSLQPMQAVASVEVGWWLLLLAITFLIGEAMVVRWLELRF